MTSYYGITHYRSGSKEGGYYIAMSKENATGKLTVNIYPHKSAIGIASFSAPNVGNRYIIDGREYTFEELKGYAIAACGRTTDKEA